MKSLFFTLLLATFCAATGYGQTLKSLMYNTTNGQVVYSGTNTLTFTNAFAFSTNTALAQTLGNLGLSTTNSPKFASVSLGDGPNNDNTAFIITDYNDEVQLSIEGLSYFSQYDFEAQISVAARSFWSAGNVNWTFYNPITFNNATNAATTRTNLGLGETNDVTFARVYADEMYINGSIGATANFTNTGNIFINQSTTNNGLLFIYRTNNEPFLGLANLIASNNTTISNETLFRVGTAEATNRSAQFGFRSTNTNGSGVAVFSVFGYNALMMVGVDASTNAVIYSGGGTNNEVMTLIKSGATEFARPISFSTTAHAAATRTNLALGATRDPTFRDVSVRDLSIVGGSGGKIVYPATNTAPANTTNVVTWIQVNVGTNSYRVPLYQ
jgi:hypothetical protein